MSITTLIDKLDNFEIIRDQIALILATETVSQQALATEQCKDPADWKLRIFTERSNPFSEYENDPTDTSPLVNIWYDNSTFDLSASNVMSRQKSETIYNIDCYGFGKSTDVDGGGHDPGDREASFEAQRCVRLVRNILMASIYTYLDLPRGTVWSRFIRSIRAFEMQIDNRKVQQVVAARIEFGVHFNELSPQFEPCSLDLLSIDILRAENGEILVEADYLASETLMLHLQADDTSTITDSSFVSEWRDISGTANNATQCLVPNRPATGVDTLNSLNVLTFDGDNDYLTVETGCTLCNIFDNGGTMFFVVRTFSAGETGNGRIISVGDNMFIGLSDPSGGKNHLKLFKKFDGNDGIFRTSELAISDAFVKILTITYDSSDVANTAVFYVNGTSINSMTLSTPVGNAVSNDGVDLLIGSNDDTTLSFDGNIGEILVYNRILLQADISTISASLLSKWF